MINEDLISMAVENNPRELKRFLNNFIVAFEIFNSIENFKANELLLIQAIQLRWNQFYNLLMISGDKKFLRELEKYIRMDEDTRLKVWESDEVKEDNDKNYVLRIRKLSNYKTDSELWNFLTKNSETLSNITDLTIYRRSVEVGIEPSIATTNKNQEAYALLKSGQISTFNKRIAEFGNLDLPGANLPGANLPGANLRHADLSHADLSHADLSHADLRHAKLYSAGMSSAKLRGAFLSHADLRRAILSDADLNGAFLNSVNLSNANLSNADLSSSVIIGCKEYANAVINENTNFYNAIVDEKGLLIYLIDKNAKCVPFPIEDKNELEKRLIEKRFSEEEIMRLLRHSSLPTK
jgi:hypothetical protein